MICYSERYLGASPKIAPGPGLAVDGPGQPWTKLLRPLRLSNQLPTSSAYIVRSWWQWFRKNRNSLWVSWHLCPAGARGRGQVPRFSRSINGCGSRCCSAPLACADRAGSATSRLRSATQCTSNSTWCFIHVVSVDHNPYRLSSTVRLRFVPHLHHTNIIQPFNQSATSSSF